MSFLPGCWEFHLLNLFDCFFFFLCFLFFSLHPVWHLGTLVPPTRDWTHTPPAVKAQSLNHWTTREIPCLISSHVSPPMIPYPRCFLCELELKVWFKLSIWGQESLLSFGAVHRSLHPSRSSSSVYPTALLLKVVTELSWQQYDASMGTSFSRLFASSRQSVTWWTWCYTLPFPMDFSVNHFSIHGQLSSAMISSLGVSKQCRFFSPVILLLITLLLVGIIV